MQNLQYICDPSSNNISYTKPL